jgi:hypothetical protein
MEVDSQESPLSLSGLRATLDGGDMEGNKGSGGVGNKDTVLVHIHVNLSSFEVSREFTDGLVSFVFIHLLDLLLLDSKVEVSTLVFDHQLLHELFVDQALVFLSLLNVS